MTLEIIEFACYILRTCIYKIVLEHYRNFTYTGDSSMLP